MATPDDVAEAVLSEFRRLPPKGKPLVRSNGVKEWTVLAGVVVYRDDDEDPTLRCVALATGVKAIPNESLARCTGNVLHDMHAEILAVRAFNRFVLDECADIENSVYFERTERDQYKFKAHPHLKIDLYVSEAPCGDSSMSQTSNGEEDSWTDPLVTIGGEDTDVTTADVPGETGERGRGSVVRGRDHFKHTGLVRTKPGRRDSPVTWSKSCTDKLCVMQFTSLLKGPISRIVSPAGVYLHRLIVPEDSFCPEDFQRAFNVRMDLDKHADWQSGAYRPRPFAFFSTTKTFEFAKSDGAKPCPTSIISTSSRPTEAVLNGVKMGSKPFTAKGLSSVCRRSMWLGVVSLSHEVPECGYLEWKKQDEVRGQAKRKVYECLGAWTCTAPDDFLLEQSELPKRSLKRPHEA